MKPIYKPAGRALEYSPDALACNIFTGCPHRCYYCFAPTVLHKDRKSFHANVAPREGIIEALKKQLNTGTIEYYEEVVNGPIKSKQKRIITLPGKLIHLCFSCDPYPVGNDTSATREAIKAIKDAGCHVQILTKGGTLAERDFDLLDTNDWFGVTITGARREEEPFAQSEHGRESASRHAHERGIKTWVSCEPVIDPSAVYRVIERWTWIDLLRIGKLNYHPININWADFGRECERLCKEHGRDYYIKANLRAEMEIGGAR